MMPDVRIAVAGVADAGAWASLRGALWPGEDDEHRRAIAAMLADARADLLTLLAFVGDDAVGLAEASIRRDHVNGCDASPVAFLEGLYVDRAWRRQGVARRLVDRVSAWGAASGCREFASDAPIDNVASHALHRALGFAETERVIFFRRELAA